MIYNCYSAGPGLFPRKLENGQFETWDEAQARVRRLNAAIDAVDIFEVITPSSSIESYKPTFETWEELRPCMMLQDLLFSAQSDIVFADVTPFGGREPDSGTVVEAVTCALSGGLLVLWSDPLTTFAERYADADVNPSSEFDVNYNVMLEQLYMLSWKLHFGVSYPVFDGLSAAVEETARQVRMHGLERKEILKDLQDAEHGDVVKAVMALMRKYQLKV